MHTRKLGHIRSTDVAIAGGKGAALGELLAAAIPVPPGFVITTDAFIHFLQSNHISKPSAATILKATIPRIVQDEILTNFKALNSPFVAVRSSATAEDGAAHAWAGQLESYVPTTEQNLLTHIKKCWASLFSSRALAYREQAGATDVSMAVVVQKLIDSQISGIAFSVHPITGNANHIMVEMVHGLGEAAVGGHVTPHAYVLDKSSGRVLEMVKGTQQKQLVRTADGEATWQPIAQNSAALSHAALQELAHLVRRIESHFGFACDIEWAYRSGAFFIVQSRPITTI